mgnify:CR=1 FL=1
MKFFRKGRYIYIPNSLGGYLIWLVAIVFLITVFVAIDKDSHSASDTLYGIFPYFVSTFLMIEWFASKTSK